MKREPILLINVIFAFAAFLLCFGNACYEYGVNAGHSDGLGSVIVFPLVYFAALIAAIVIFHKEFDSTVPYIFMGVVIVAFMALMWIILCVTNATATDSNPVLWFPITLTVLTVIMSALYFISAFQFYRNSKKSAL